MDERDSGMEWHRRQDRENRALLVVVLSVILLLATTAVIAFAYWKG